MSTLNERIIPVSRTKVLLLTIASCAFVAAGAWMLSLDEATIQAQRRLSDPLLFRGVAVAGIVFFGLAGLYAARKLFDKKPGLVLSPSGILDNSSAVSAGLLPWNEITGTEVVRIQKHKLLVITVKDPERYIERGGRLRRALNRANYRMVGSPISISSNALRISFDELVALVRQYHASFGPPSQQDSPAT